MTKIKHLNIPQPCTQDWNRMTATDSGRHCQSCCKIVVDFTRMSNDEIIGYLSANHHVCARIGAQQIDSVNMQLVSRQPQNKGGWAKWVVAASLFMSTAYSRANAQSITPSIEQINGNNPHAESFPLGKIAMPDSAKYQVITGTVTDLNHEPLPGATIKVNGGNVGTQTDTDGNFRLRVPLSTKQVKVSFIGFESTVIEIKKAGKVLKVRLKENTTMLGGMGVTRTSSLKQLYAGLVQRLSLGKLNREV
ncbi:carboxypeptidase-like regulatory domain-containing protein [Mucilaginibacter sp.]|uniref:carboxypeptidase-like regulatory domain-containing protein n=1 Tax=Mucilaginibacter sp. TaxID=1882438 RepID=UPI0025FAC56B|nr:carboxypeptidase-like regulatory domain-containing protein [Mucilaginibacter sp.]